MSHILNFGEFIDRGANVSAPLRESVNHDNMFINNVVDFREKITLVCVSINKRRTNEVLHLRKACEANGVEFIYANFENPDVTIRTEGGGCVLTVDGVSYMLSRANTIVVKRHARMSNEEVHKKFITFVENDYLIINSRESISVCRNKVLTAERLKEYGVSQPKFVAFGQDNIGNFDAIMDKADFDYPVIAKVNKGSQGNGVFIFDTKQSLKGVAEYIISKADVIPSDMIIVQERVDSDCDLRIHVLRTEKNPRISPNDEYIVLAAMQRNKIKGDYRSNVSLGAEFEPYIPKEDEIELAIKAAKAVGCIACGVDIMRDKKSGKLYVIEVNSTPSLDGISRVSEKDPATVLVKSLKDAFEKGRVKSDKKDEKRMGYKETFYIKGLDKPLVALIDSGNNSYTTILVDEFEVDKENGVVKWKLYGKKFKTKYEGDAEFFSAGGLKIQQPTTRVDLVHDGETFKNVKVKLSDVKKRTDKGRDMNVGRKLLTKMNAVIIPSTKHLNNKK